MQRPHKQVPTRFRPRFSLLFVVSSPAAHELQSTRTHHQQPQMSPPSGSPVPATERRLSVLLSHLHPSASPLAGDPGANAERHQLLAVAAAEAGCLTASPCAGGGEGVSSGSGYCIFCEIVKGTKPAYKLYEDDMCLCILDVKPLSPGHSLVIPKGHFPSLQETSPSVLGGICSKLPLLGKAIIKATQCDAFNVLINNGEEAGQVIFHTHVHIIPRSKDDGLWSSETYQRNSIMDNQDTKNLVSSIKELLSSSPEDHSAEGSTIPKEH